MSTPQVLVLNQSGIPMNWASWQLAVTYKCKDLITWETGEIDWTKFGGINRISGLRSFVKISPIIAVKNAHFPKYRIPPLTNLNLFGRDLNICAYCGGKFTLGQLTNDHIIPRSRGGEHKWTNCVTACKICNNLKGDKLLENTNMQLLYVPYTPTREETLIMKNRKILECQMELLKATLPKHSRLL